jgi:lipoprotein-anchoring transpeptidase ErfK/SrfK
MQRPFSRAAVLLCALCCAWPLSAAPLVETDRSDVRDTAPTVSPPPATTPVAPAQPAKPTKAAKAATTTTRVPALKPGEYRWWPELAPEGPVAIVISLPEQRVHVYRNGLRIGVSTASTGKRGFETKTGVFPILERQSEHFSNLYDNAPMPFMLRLTWSGTALHAGKVPGYPASHGCIRLPKDFAEKLFHTSRRGVIVVIADADSHPADVISPAWLTPIDAATGAVRDTVNDAQSEWWMPERSPEGPVTMVLSTRERLLVVLRNGIEIGHANAVVTGEPAKGTQLYSLRAEIGDEARITVGTPLPDPPPTLSWRAIAIPGKPATPGAARLPLRGGQIKVSGTFAQQLQTALPTDATVTITDETLRYVPPAAPVEPPRDATPVTAPAPPLPQTPPVTH